MSTVPAGPDYPLDDPWPDVAGTLLEIYTPTRADPRIWVTILSPEDYTEAAYRPGTGFAVLDVAGARRLVASLAKALALVERTDLAGLDPSVIR
jgi:hypothetical protein